MANTKPAPTFRGRSLGILILVATQSLVGVIHLIFGFWILFASDITAFFSTQSGPDIYSMYTIVFSILTLIFAVGLWLTKNWGWVGTVAVAVFVIIADTLTLLDLPSIPGIPKFAGFGEISYSLLVLVYLLQPYIRTSFRIRAA